jgi:hypothetical protein
MSLTILDKIEEKRQSLLKGLIDQLHDLSDNLCRGLTCQNFACRSMMLGALLQELRGEKLHSECPSEPFLGSSLSLTLETVRRFESPPLYHEDENTFYGDAEDVWVLQENSYRTIFPTSMRKKKHVEEYDYEEKASVSDTPHRLMAHSWRLQNTLKPIINGLEVKIEGLELK